MVAIAIGLHCETRNAYSYNLLKQHGKSDKKTSKASEIEKPLQELHEIKEHNKETVHNAPSTHKSLLQQKKYPHSWRTLPDYHLN